MTSRTTITDPARVAEDKGITTPCRSREWDPEAWFAQATTAAGRARSEAARNLCAYSCPLQAMCRDWAMAKGEKFGIYGGLSESQRETLRKGGRLRDNQARWLAGQADYAGNPILPRDNTADEADEDQEPSRLVATPEAVRMLDLNSPQALRALLGRHNITPAVRGNQNQHSQYKLGDLLQVKARKRRYTSPTTAA